MRYGVARTFSDGSRPHALLGLCLNQRELERRTLLEERLEVTLHLHYSQSELDVLQRQKKTRHLKEECV